MVRLRSLIRQQHMLAMFIVALALCAKAVLPSGYMVGSSASKFLTVQICSDVAGKTMQIEIPGDGKSQDQSGDHNKADSPCTFTALSLASLAAADASLLVLALAFVFALGFAAIAPAPLEQISYLRPPLRGPPATI